MTNKIQLCRIIYYSLAALQVSSDIFVHHQEHLNCITTSGITHVCRCQMVSWECWNVLHTSLPDGIMGVLERITHVAARWYHGSAGTYYTRMSLPAGSNIRV